MSKVGFDHVAVGEELQQAAGAPAAFVNVFSERRRSQPVALLGQLFAAPLMLSSYTTLWTVAVPGTGKTVAASSIFRFFSTHTFQAREFQIVLSDGATPHATSLLMAWNRHLPFIADDFKMIGSAADRRMGEVGNAIPQSAFGGGQSPKGNQTGGLRATRRASCPAIVTGEQEPPSGSGADRALVTDLTKDDVALVGPGGSYHDAPFTTAFVAPYLHSGLANALYAAYIQWVGTKLEELGVEGLRAHTEQLAASSPIEGLQGRALDKPTTMRVGWLMFRQFARERGIEEVLPSMDIVDAALADLGQDAEETASEGRAGQRHINAISELLAGARVHFVTRGGRIPDYGSLSLPYASRMGGETIPNRFGYRQRDAGMEHAWFAPGPEIGVVSDDARFVLLTPAGFDEVTRLAGLPPAKPRDRNASLKDFLAEGSPEKPAYAAGFGVGSAKGWVFEVATFGIDMPTSADGVDFD